MFGFPPADAGGENPVQGGGDLLTLLNDSDQRQEGVGYMSRDRHRQRRGSHELVHLAAQGLRRQPLPERGDQGRGGLRLLRDGVPVRRLGRHAGRGRHGLVLEGDDRLDQRRRGPRHRAGQHRGRAGRRASRPRRRRSPRGAGVLARAPRRRQVPPDPARTESSHRKRGQHRMVLKALDSPRDGPAGVGGALVVFWLLNKLSELLPGSLEHRHQAVPLHPPGVRRDRRLPRSTRRS